MRNFLIITTRHKDLYFGGSALLFWCADSNGYTAAMETAGLYTEEEALEKGKGTHGEDVPVPIERLGVNESFFRTAETGLKELEKITIMNKHNEANKKLINDCRKLYC